MSSIDTPAFMSSVSTQTPMHLPIIKTSQQAVALAQQTQDIFYLAAYKLQVWISQLSTRAIANYANKPNPADRPMQTGQAWRTFQRIFGQVRGEGLLDVINCLTRFSECENPLSMTLFAALAPVYLEHELSGDFIRPKVPDLSSDPRQAALMRRSVERMCDWLDALIHLSTHLLWFREPACFDPDPENRRLAARDISQVYAAQMDDASLVAPYLQPATMHHRGGSAFASASSKSPGRAAERPWPFPQLDQALIGLWPLLKLHNWTYADLCKVLGDAAIPLAPAFCQNHRRLATYCLKNLGLRKSSHGRTARNSNLPGHALAQRLLRPARASAELGCGPWS